VTQIDIGTPVVKPTDSNPDAASKAKRNTSDPAKKSAKDGSLPNDKKPSTSVKEEEVEVEGEQIAEAETTETEMEIDLSDDVKALVSSDADLSEEFKEKLLRFLKLLLRQEYKEQTKSP
jgi:hypothetical protein